MVLCCSVSFCGYLFTPVRPPARRYSAIVEMWSVRLEALSRYRPMTEVVGSTVTDRAHDGEVPHSSHRTVGLWAVSVRAPTEIAGFIYRHGGVRILTSDSVAQPRAQIVVVVSAVVGVIPRLKPWTFSLKRCKLQLLGCESSSTRKIRAI